MPLTGKQAPLLIILGATAVGKTGLALELAEALNGEIIGADSRQIYRLMDIGTAKPNPSQLTRVKHHLIDVVNPDEMLTVAAYQDLAYHAIDDILGRGKLPMLVGGTGQYLTAVEEGWSFPRVPPNYDLRSQLEAELEQSGVAAFYEQLVTVDPVAAEKIHPNNTRRIIRALEVYRETGSPISLLQQKQAPPYRIYRLGLYLEREALYQRADKRVDEMLLEGFLEEVQHLLDLGYSRKLASMTALGYRELTLHLLDGLSLADAVQQTKYSTHDFIRRQEVWFKGHDNGILWHNSKDLVLDNLLEQLKPWIEE